MSTCIECESPVEPPSDVIVGEIMACSSCGAELEVRELKPVRLELAPEVEEDWGE